MKDKQKIVEEKKPRYLKVEYKTLQEAKQDGKKPTKKVMKRR